MSRLCLGLYFFPLKVPHLSCTTYCCGWAGNSAGVPQQLESGGPAHSRPHRKFSCCCHTGRKWPLLRLFFNEDTDVSFSFRFLASELQSTAMQSRRHVCPARCSYLLFLCLRFGRPNIISAARKLSLSNSRRLAC